MIRKRFPVLAAISAVALLQFAGCSDAPKKAREPEKPALPMTGRQAFQQMFLAARSWKTDAQPLQLHSINMAQVKSENGKAGAWEATFVSPSTRRSKLYTWSAVEGEGNLHQGVFAGPDQSWSPSGPAMPFDIPAIRTDSDAALETAMAQKDSVTFSKKHPDLPIVFMLEKTRRFPDLVWRVVWGDSVGTSEYSVFVDATTGKYLEKVH